MNKLITSIKDTHIYIGLFIISYFFFLINYQGLYWDDWVAYNQERATLAIFFDMLQHNIKGEFFLIISKFFNHIYLFRIFTFITYAFIAYATYKILVSTKIFNESESKLISFLSVIIPINSSIIAISIIPFLFPVLLFYIAFFLLTKYYDNSNKSLRFIILFIFFFSFSTNSLLVFYAIVLLYVYYMDNNQQIKLSFTTIKLFFLKKVDFILLPIIYFLYKKTFLVPYGLYNNYNAITSDNLQNIGHIMLKTFNIMFVGMVEILTTNFFMLLISLFVAFIFTFFINSKNKLFDKKSKIAILILLASILFIIAVFPYAAVGKQPVLHGWNGRFSLLLGISLSMFFVAVVSIISKFFFKYRDKAFLVMISTVLMLFIFKNITTQYHQNMDWFYQVSVMENFKENTIIRDNTTFIVHSKINNKFVYERVFVYYEWNGMLKKAFGDTKRLMIPPFYRKLLPRINASRIHKQYNFYEWDRNQKPINVVIDLNIEPTYKMKIKLFFNYIFNYEMFLKIAKKLTTVSIIEE